MYIYRLMDNAREIIAESLPIKCLEAVVLGLYLTSSLLHTQRLCISFKTSFRGHTYRHVVLGVQHKAQYGALGMSRRSDLMYKSLQYKVRMNTSCDCGSLYGGRWVLHKRNSLHKNIFQGVLETKRLKFGSSSSKMYIFRALYQPLKEQNFIIKFRMCRKAGGGVYLDPQTIKCFLWKKKHVIVGNCNL